MDITVERSFRSIFTGFSVEIKHFSSNFGFDKPFSFFNLWTHVASNCLQKTESAKQLFFGKNTLISAQKWAKMRIQAWHRHGTGMAWCQNKVCQPTDNNLYYLILVLTKSRHASSRELINFCLTTVAFFIQVPVKSRDTQFRVII